MFIGILQNIFWSWAIIFFLKLQRSYFGRIARFLYRLLRLVAGNNFFSVYSVSLFHKSVCDHPLSIPQWISFFKKRALAAINCVCTMYLTGNSKVFDEFALPLCICCTTRYHSFYPLMSLVVIRCTTRCHSLSLFVIRCATHCHLLPFVVTRCTPCLSFYKRSE